MRKPAILICLLLLSLSDAWAFRCGHQLVQVGDYKWDVLERCGYPEWRDQRIALRGSRLRHPYGALEEDRYEEVVIDEWIYNFGPTKFKRLLYFENGVLKNIRQLDYGR